jgi:Ca-activated chloride channel family protein
MLPRSKSLCIALIAASTAFASAQSQSAAPPGQQPIVSPLPPADDAVPVAPPPAPAPSNATDESLPTHPAPNQPGETAQVPSPGQVTKGPNDSYTFRKDVQEVLLYATVVDPHQRPVTDLDKAAFSVFEDGQPQQITHFERRDVPVSLGILIDNSGSMRMKRPSVNQAALNLVRASNPKDQVFVVNFNDEAYMDQDYTSSVPLLKDALEKIEARGGTAMYDAVVASADHLAKSSALDKKVLLVITDGEDNESGQTLEEAVRRVQDENGPTVYTIGILDNDREGKRAKRALTRLALETGGVAFFPQDLSEVDAISQQIAKDIRNQYTIGYKPTRPQTEGGFRNVRVEAREGKDKLQVRTRSGYFAGQPRQTARTQNPGQ